MNKPNTIGYDVDYNVLDIYKRLAMSASSTTASCLLQAGFKEISESRGESAYLIQNRNMILAFVVEGIGTLNLVAEEYLQLTGVSFMAQIHRANFATIMNDLMACGAAPLIASGLMSVGDESYFKNPMARDDAVMGWVDSCLEVNCAAGGGETQKLRDIVAPTSAVLAGAALGIIKPKSRYIRGNIRDGDRLVMAASSGVHANGVTLARDVSKQLPDGYLTMLHPIGKTYGEALLGPPHVLYGPLIQRALNIGIPIRYVSNITGHGWRKVMRSNKKFTYVIKKLLSIPKVFQQIQEHSGATDKKMLETFNMGGGCMFVVAPEGEDALVNLMGSMGYGGDYVGFVEKGPRQVEIEPYGITFKDEDYQVR